MDSDPYTQGLDYLQQPSSPSQPAQNNMFLDYLSGFMNPNSAFRPGFQNSGQNPGGYKPAEQTTNKSGQSAAAQAGMGSLCGSGGAGAAAGAL